MSSEVFDLTVQDVRRTAEDAVVLTLGLPPAVREAFRHQPGQHVMVRFTGADGEEEFRSYSICQAPPADGSAPDSVRVGIRLLGPGGFAELAHTTLGPGSVVGVLAPRGRFRLRPGGRHLAVAAGSGITPVLAMAQAALARGDEFRLLYGNRTVDSTMFAAELTELQGRHPDRFTVHRLLSRERGEAPYRSGRIDADTLPARLAELGLRPDDPEAQHYLCGPAGLVNAAREVLERAGVPGRRVHSELFALTPLTGLNGL